MTSVRRFLRCGIMLASIFACMAHSWSAQADPAGPGPAGGDGGADGGPQTIAKFTAGATGQPGLFTVWRKGDKVFLQLHKDQLGKDFIQSAVPQNGLGGWGLLSGGEDYAPARLMRFTRKDDAVTITWPNTDFIAPSNAGAQKAVKVSFADSSVGTAHVVAEDKLTGDIVIDADAFLGDVMDFADALKFDLGTDFSDSYRLDDHSSSYGPTKAFPNNVLLQVDQTWVTDKPDVVDNVPDPRAINFRISYNIVAAPDDGYMPRLGDDRVGFWDNEYLNFSTDRVDSRTVHYIDRWNFKPADPTKPSMATNPMVVYLSDTIPQQYKPAIRDALLEWNKAYAKAGILNAIQVKDQPDDPAWDPDDVRYNVARWVTESNSGGFAEANVLADPRTGEEIRTGIIFDADLMTFGHSLSQNAVQPITAFDRLSRSAREREYALGAAADHAYGEFALRVLGADRSYSSDRYDYDWLKSLALHESGHDMGLMHNFIASQAYSAAQLQSASFTSRMGVTSSVMAYSPINLWPRGTSHGALWQDVLGPYDYYAIRYGYAPIPGATTPQAELPTLRAWASDWTNPQHMLASDEDVFWTGHAIDPRVGQFELSNDNLSWAATQAGIAQSLLRQIDARMPLSGRPYESERNAFDFITRFEYFRPMNIATHYIGGEYLSRSHPGDPHAAQPLQPVPRAQELRAWSVLDKYMFADDAWHFSASTLNRLTYQEWEPFNTGGAWAYAPPDRHDEPVIELVGQRQMTILQTFFTPQMLARLDALSLKAAPGATMSTADLFDWAQRSVFGGLQARSVDSLPAIRRNLQAGYATLLIRLAVSPAAGTPAGAQALARAKLVELSATLGAAHESASMDEESRAHLALLQARVHQALNAQIALPVR